MDTKIEKYYRVHLLQRLAQESPSVDANELQQLYLHYAKHFKHLKKKTTAQALDQALLGLFLSALAAPRPERLGLSEWVEVQTVLVSKYAELLPLLAAFETSVGGTPKKQTFKSKADDVKHEGSNNALRSAS